MARSRKNRFALTDSDFADMVAGRDYLWSRSQLPDGTTMIPENWKEIFAESDARQAALRRLTGSRSLTFQGR